MIAISTPTIDDYVEVVEYALSIGKNWLLPTADDRLLISNWHKHKSETCVLIDGFIGFSSMEYCTNENMNVLNMNEFRRKFYCNIDKLLKDFK